MKLLDILVPTWNNERILTECLLSLRAILHGPPAQLTRVIVINNGHPGLAERIGIPWVEVIEAGGNKGWEGGLNLGLTAGQAPFVAFCNDDVRFVEGDKSFFWKMLATMNDPAIGAVGPSSNFVMGVQSIFYDSVEKMLDVPYLIGFFMLLRREALEKAGGIDDTLPGGDDMDLSIRLKDAGYRLACRRDAFLFHHGAVTGGRIHAGHWNSQAMQEATCTAIIRKHGMLKFWETMVVGWMRAQGYNPAYAKTDAEGDICRRYVDGAVVYEFGCGSVKTVPHAVGFDIYPYSATIPTAGGTDNGEKSVKSVADVVADVSITIPVPSGLADTVIARHILEHCADPIGTMICWGEAMKPGGTLIIAVPNQEIGNTIVMNPEHLHGFTPASLERMAYAAGFKQRMCHTEVNGVSFVAVFDKVCAVEAEPSRRTIHCLGAKLAGALA